MQCIWCKKPTTDHEPAEHIIPDSLGCPTHLVLRHGEVCRRCNQGKLARLDQVLINQLELVRFFAGVPNKRGQPPTIATWTNAQGRYRDGRPHLAVNMGYQVAKTGQGANLAPFAQTSKHLRVLLREQSAGNVSITLRQFEICNSRKAVQALHKIAFEVLARCYGIEKLMLQRYDPVRRFVLSGDGNRVAILVPASNEPTYTTDALVYEDSKTPSEIILIKLGPIGFAVDLSPRQEHVPDMKRRAEASGQQWTWVPL